MLTVRNGQSILVVMSINEVTHQESRTSFLNCTCQEFQRNSQIGAVTIRHKIKQLTNEIQNMSLTLLRRNEFFDSIGKKHYSHFIIILYCSECQSRSNLSQHIPFHTVRCTEM